MKLMFMDWTGCICSWRGQGGKYVVVEAYTAFRNVFGKTAWIVLKNVLPLAERQKGYNHLVQCNMCIMDTGPWFVSFTGKSVQLLTWFAGASKGKCLRFLCRHVVMKHTLCLYSSVRTFSKLYFPLAQVWCARTVMACGFCCSHKPVFFSLWNKYILTCILQVIFI
jgi:hypothetical protein